MVKNRINDEFDTYMENELNATASKIEVPTSLFHKTMDAYAQKRSFSRKVQDLFSTHSTQRVLAGAMCAMLISVSCVFTFSKDARVVALEGLNSVKTFMGWEQAKDNSYELNMPGNDSKVFFTLKNIYKTDSQIKEKLGYTIQFPQNAQAFNFTERSIDASFEPGASKQSVIDSTDEQLATDSILANPEYKKGIVGSYTSGSNQLFIHATKEGDVNIESLKTSAIQSQELQVADGITMTVLKSSTPLVFTTNYFSGLNPLEGSTKPNAMEPYQNMVMKANGVLYEISDYNCKLTLEDAKALAKNLIELNQ